jgi:hypothetical protein
VEIFVLDPDALEAGRLLQQAKHRLRCDVSGLLGH